MMTTDDDETHEPDHRSPRGRPDTGHRSIDALRSTGLGPRAVPRGPDVYPSRLGRFEILGVLGRGSVSTVFEAFHPRLGREFALRVIQDDFVRMHTRRLFREARALAQLHHPNVVDVYDIGVAGHRHFLVMELVRGLSLREWMARSPRPSWIECVRMFLAAGEGLAAAHDSGLVHRDFTPDNAIVRPDGRVQVIDFRVVGITDHESTDGDPLTRSGTVLGTPAYTPLVQLRGREADVHSDQWSFCASLYEALYGEHPFDDESIETLLLSMGSESVRPAPADSEIPTAVRRLLLRGLALDPAARWPSMSVLLERLRRHVGPNRHLWQVLGWRWS